ncbi:MAG: 16S rRNA (uracil(1498)-N(3))-methyltransferase [Ignavibacteriae bacterium]|nr:16S rRNA (uracil(1498)-N(3))-methyltransferase [Ignavibacteriota bacterium]MCB9209523.1 16S rRNA (uracil(1498)-N(3))-methyltransferase [Ignavibacteriales bacterium]MCB9258166.1 16S rRNA (uracil(1498)-N(3))-methyltransferase [Ignavibacteriales bacterium]
MNLIIISESDKISENKYSISDDRFIHIKSILKSDVNDSVEIGLLNGKTGKAKILSLTNSDVILEIISLEEIIRSTFHVDLICALPRPQTLKKILSISATMGIGKIYFIKSEKVEKSYFHSPLLKEENYTKFLIDGLSQGKRTILPKVSFHHYFKKFFDLDFSEYDIKLLAHPNVSDTLLNLKLNKENKILIAIGPEGGWNDFEIEYLTNCGFIKFQLSNNILRVENALMAALSQIELLTSK